MSILIKGATLQQVMRVIMHSTEWLSDDVEIVEVHTPHGRLIDADNVTKKMEKIATEAWQMKLSDTVEHTLNMSMDIIKGVPTVIGSEGE